MADAPAYLAPYLKAVRRHGSTFPSLLWASPSTQATRFDAICGIEDLNGESVLDVGCGRADLLDFMLAHQVRPADYVGIEAVEELARAAEAKGHANLTILRADFVSEPARMFVGADAVIFSGSLNTLDDDAFYGTIGRAFEATADWLIFNFLSSSYLAAKDYLYWRRAPQVESFVRKLTRDVRVLSGYLQGDCTIALRREL